MRFVSTVALLVISLCPYVKSWRGQMSFTGQAACWWSAVGETVLAVQTHAITANVLLPKSPKNTMRYRTLPFWLVSTYLCKYLVQMQLYYCYQSFLVCLLKFWSSSLNGLSKFELLIVLVSFFISIYFTF